jgi:benzylsuccinate CoA-transferase BbsF subunit
MTPSALEGVKVLDFTWAALGPVTCDYFAVYGASVIKIETENRPDPWRTMSPFAGDSPGLDRSGLFAFANTEKYSMALNLKHPRGIEVAQRLVRWADIVVESYTPGSMDRLGLGYEDLKRIKPDIIMLSTCMYGQTGPFARLPGFGLTLTGASGISHLAGWADRPPLPSGAYTDFVVPKFNVLALLAALDYRRRTGKGQYLDVSQLEAALHFQIPVLLEYTANGRELERIGNRSPYAAPQGVYRCKGENNWCALSVESEQDWENFCRVMDKQVWVDDPRFATSLARQENLEPLNKLIEEWTQHLDAEEVMNLLQNGGVSAGVAQNGEQLDRDPQLKHRNYYCQLDHPEMGPFSYSGFSMKMSATPYEITRGAPRLGEHTEYVCSEILKMTDEEFVQLLNEGVFE